MRASGNRIIDSLFDVEDLWTFWNCGIKAETSDAYKKKVLTLVRKALSSTKQIH
jgi:hypothetical protein